MASTVGKFSSSASAMGSRAEESGDRINVCFEYMFGVVVRLRASSYK